MSRAVAVLVASVALFAGCVAPAPAPTVPPSVSAPGGQQVLANSLDVPWDLAVLPDGSVLITLRSRAELVRVADGATRLVQQVGEVVPAGEGGLLGIALSPKFPEDQWIYLYYTTADDNRVVRYRYSEHGLSEPRAIITGIPRAANHDGGRLRFGPDGLLYIGTGDAAQGTIAQDTGALAGKILRVAADGSIPAGNPFGNAVYSYGHRNVQGLGWDASGQLYASEFGQDTWDELNLIRPGGNYGWPQSEGMTVAAGLTPPALVWRTSEASPSGIAVTGDGVVYLAALRGERVWRTSQTPDGMSPPTVFLRGLGRIRAVEVVGDRLYVLTNNTARGTARPLDDKLIAVPLG